MKSRYFAVAAALIVVFAWLPHANAQRLLRELERRLNDTLAPRSPDAAESEPGYLGLFADEATGGDPGVEVISVNRGGPAEAAGLRPGDRIEAINRRQINSIDDMAGVLERFSAGERVEFEFVRDRRRHNVEVTLARRPSGDSPPPEEEVGPREPFPESTPSAVAPPAERTPVFGEDRPVLRRVEGLLDRIVSPASPAPVPMPDERTELAELKQLVESLQDQVLTLERRMAELEAKLAAERARGE